MVSGAEWTSRIHVVDTRKPLIGSPPTRAKRSMPVFGPSVFLYRGQLMVAVLAGEVPPEW
jgi:hypothetical protein